MKLIFFIGLGCFCFNQVISTPTDEIENEIIPEEIFKSNELCSRIDSKTHLMDLNIDCQLLVLEQMDFISLLPLAETNLQYKSLVSLFLERIFRRNVVNIELTNLEEDLVIINPYIHSIKIENTTFAKQLLNNFGHLIQNLEINRVYPYEDESYRSIYKLVNLHCSKTLKKITSKNSLDNILEEFTNQFEKVEEVFIDNISKTGRRLNEIFPSVRRLHFSTYEISNTDSINVKYMNLEHLNIHINEYVELTNKFAAELIRKNSHIRSLALESASVELIKNAADLLPQLERLELVCGQNKFNHNNESISFPNVKIFKEGNSKFVSNYYFLNLKFGNVEELYTDDLAENMFNETGFFASNKKLQKLQLEPKYGGIYLDSDAFKQLARANTTLRQIFINRAVNVEVETILQLIENNKQLEKLQITFYTKNGRESTLKILERKLSYRWSLEIYQRAFRDTAIILEKTHT